MFLEPTVVTLCGVMVQKHPLGEPRLTGLWEESLHPKNSLFVASGSNLLTGCLVSTLDSQYILNKEATVIHLTRSDHVTLLLKTSNGSRHVSCPPSYCRDNITKCFMDAYHMIYSFLIRVVIFHLLKTQL